jgi:hypothetical protein
MTTPRRALSIGLLAVASRCGGGTPVDTTPSVAITSPRPSAAVILPQSMEAPIVFSVTSFTLKAAGSCGATSACGHVDLLVDQMACDDPLHPPPSGYNATASASPAMANFSLCASPSGPHTVTLELHDDSGQPILDGNGSTVSASVAIMTL